MKLSETQIDAYLSGIRTKLIGADVDVEFKGGVTDLTKTGDEWRIYKPNGTFTFTFKINGGACDD